MSEHQRYPDEKKMLELSESKGLQMVLDTPPETQEAQVAQVAPTADPGQAGTPPADVDD